MNFIITNLIWVQTIIIVILVLVHIGYTIQKGRAYNLLLSAYTTYKKYNEDLINIANVNNKELRTKNASITDSAEQYLTALNKATDDYNILYGDFTILQENHGKLERHIKAFKKRKGVCYP